MRDLLASHAAFALCAALCYALPSAAQTCTYNLNVEERCGQRACVVSDPSKVRKGAVGQCGTCAPPGIDTDGTEQCGGYECRADGTCAVQPARKREPVWPTFHLAVVDVSTTLADAKGYSFKPIIGAGYLFQGALGMTNPQPQPDGTYVTTVPSFYFDAGATAAFAGNAQDVLVRLGLLAYVPTWPVGIRTIALNGVFQRSGGAIWELDLHKNVDRLGPALSLGFLYNLFLEGGYVWALDRKAPEGQGAVLVSVVYMRDLLSDLVPDQFQKYVKQ